MTKAFTTSSKLANYLVLVVLAVVPFHALLTVWASTLVGHYTLLRLWDDIALMLLLVIASFWLVKDGPLRSFFAHSLVIRLIATYAGLTVLLGTISLLKGDVTGKALGYGLLTNLRYLAWFVAVLLAAQRSESLKKHWRITVLVPAAIVVLFGVLQYTVLPHDFLGHFGYNAATTIAPIETINHNQHYIRVQSTLRGANPLGTYLVIVLAAAGVCLLHGRKKWAYGALGVVGLLALYASGSRSAWIGTVLALAAVAWLSLKAKRSRQIFGMIAICGIVLAGAMFALLKNNVGLENAVLHTQNHSAVATTSNTAHASALKSGLKDVVHQPFGDGPGTAGPASVYNAGHPARIAEDYYIQIAQETGWIGVVLFVTILALIALELYKQVRVSPLALVLLASLIGLSFVNLLSHAWTDDALAYVWWGLAGIALAVPAKKDHEIQTR